MTVLLCPTMIYFKFNSIGQLQVFFLNSFLIVLFEYMRECSADTTPICKQTNKTDILSINLFRSTPSTLPELLPYCPLWICVVKQLVTVQTLAQYVNKQTNCEMFSIPVGIPGIEGEASKSYWRRLSQPPLSFTAGSSVSQTRRRSNKGESDRSGKGGHHSEDWPPQASTSCSLSTSTTLVDIQIKRLEAALARQTGQPLSRWLKEYQQSHGDFLNDCWRKSKTLCKAKGRKLGRAEKAWFKIQVGKAGVWFTEKHAEMWINLNLCRPNNTCQLEKISIINQAMLLQVILRDFSSLLRCTRESWSAGGRLQPGLALEKFL